MSVTEDKERFLVIRDRCSTCSHSRALSTRHNWCSMQCNLSMSGLRLYDHGNPIHSWCYALFTASHRDGSPHWEHSDFTRDNFHESAVHYSDTRCPRYERRDDT